MKQNFQFSINKRESIRLNHFNDSKVFIEYSTDMDDIHKNIYKTFLVIVKSYFKVPKDVKLNTMHFLS